GQRRRVVMIARRDAVEKCRVRVSTAESGDGAVLRIPDGDVAGETPQAGLLNVCSSRRAACVRPATEIRLQ
ncbi:MAG: hypothetical protein ACK5ES_17790, partial [Planctomyces sp.]